MINSKGWAGGVDGHGGYIPNRENPLLLSVMKVICPLLMVPKIE